MKILCQCGCEERHSLNSCIYLTVPGTRERATIHRRHAPAWMTEMELLNTVTNLIKCSQYEPFKRRWAIGKRIEEMRFKAALRLHGTAGAERIAARARFLYLCPKWVAGLFTWLKL